jgi:hypothetical protein
MLAEAFPDTDTGAGAPATACRQLIAEGERAARRGAWEPARERFAAAAALDGAQVGARRGLVLALAGADRMAEAWAAWAEAVATDPAADAWISAEIERAMRLAQFGLLHRLGRLLAQHRWGSAWHRNPAAPEAPPPGRVPRDVVSVTKLRHDAGQFAYLRRQGLIGAEFDAVIADYQDLAGRLEARNGAEARMPLDGEVRRRLGHVYNRIVHLGAGARVPRALSPEWDPAAIEAAFLDQRTGVVVIDDFLTPEALAAVHAFAKESTVWSGVRYAYGRLGAFFHDGFNCPLLLQIAEELKAALPRVITPAYPLRQVWGFKNSTDLPPHSNLHADFAAVNVNFWVAPDACNADPASGGMMVYDVDAPRAWEFHTYNGRTDIIKAFLRENQAQETYVPYRQNRCVIFNSDLFHGTHEVRFRPGFENHRINITLLYGQRENDEHHGALQGRADLEARWGGGRSAWRSPSFGRFRR